MRKITFSDVVKLAIFCAELTRQGIAFNAFEQSNGDFIVSLTGY